MRVNLTTIEQGQQVSLVLFLQEDELDALQDELTRLDQHPGIHAVVQPCPYEGIEFLYRADLPALKTQEVSVDKSIYWHALRVRSDIPKDAFKEMCLAHHDMLVATIEQDTKSLMALRRRLEDHLERFGA